jgi:hypothetical protein
MNIKTRSTATFFILLAILAAMTALSAFLPQGQANASMPASQIPAWQLALAGAGMVAVVYGGLGFLGLFLWRKLGFPDIWEESITNRQRFLLPALVGSLLGVVLIILDLVFSRLNGIGQLTHPPFPTSIIASLSAGIGEELIFRLFFVTFWTWLVGKVILRGRGLTVVYWIVSSISAVAFAASHIPTLMILTGETNPAQFSPFLLLELLLMNGLISMLAAHYFKKSGFLAPMGIHFWADIVWHTVWGLF